MSSFKFYDLQTFSSDLNTINLKIYPNHGEIALSENSTKFLKRYKALKSP